MKLFPREHSGNKIIIYFENEVGPGLLQSRFQLHSHFHYPVARKYGLRWNCFQKSIPKIKLLCISKTRLDLDCFSPAFNKQSICIILAKFVFVERWNGAFQVDLVLKQLKCICIEIFDNFLLANMKDRQKPKRKLFTVCWYLFPFQRYELSKSGKSWEKMRQENWAFCAPLTKIMTSQVGLQLIQYFKVFFLLLNLKEQQK